MSKAKWTIEEGLPGLKQTPVRPKGPPHHDTGVSFAGIQVYLYGGTDLDAQVCGEWLLQKGGPIRVSRQVILSSKIRLAILSLEYGRNSHLALASTDASDVQKFLNWMTLNIGPPPAKSRVIQARANYG